MDCIDSDSDGRSSAIGGVKQGCGVENKLFYSFMRQYLENGTSYTSKVFVAFLVRSYVYGSLEYN